MNRELYPGVIDPDGRPWLSHNNPKGYRRSLIWLLKVAALSQERLIVPRGYFFDNPQLQKVFQQYFGTGTEEQCFWHVMKNLLKIGDAENVVKGEDTLHTQDSWIALLDDWIAGKGTRLSERKVLAYPNLLEDRQHLKEILAARNVSAYREKFRAFGAQENGIDIFDLFERLAKLKLRPVIKVNEFDFDARVRRALEGKSDLDVDPKVLEKVQAVAEACKVNGLPRISRSVLQNRAFCINELQVPASLAIEENEYSSMLAPQLRHWHHLAFACSYGCGAICTEKTTSFEKAILDTALGQILDEIQLSHPSWYKLSVGLDSLSFIDIWKVRNNKKFFESLQCLRDSLQSGDKDDFRKAFDKHWRFVVTKVSWNFAIADPDQATLKALIEAGNNAIAADPYSGISSLVENARYLWSLGAGFVPQLWKDLELRYFLRRVKQLGDHTSKEREA